MRTGRGGPSWSGTSRILPPVIRRRRSAQMTPIRLSSVRSGPGGQPRSGRRGPPDPRPGAGRPTFALWARSSRRSRRGRSPPPSTRRRGCPWRTPSEASCTGRFNPRAGSTRGSSTSCPSVEHSVAWAALPCQRVWAPVPESGGIAGNPRASALLDPEVLGYLASGSPVGCLIAPSMGDRYGVGPRGAAGLALGPLDGLAWARARRRRCSKCSRQRTSGVTTTMGGWSGRV